MSNQETCDYLWSLVSGIDGVELVRYKTDWNSVFFRFGSYVWFLEMNGDKIFAGYVSGEDTFDSELPEAIRTVLDEKLGRGVNPTMTTTIWLSGV